MQQASVTARPSMTKDQLIQLLTLTQSDREREVIKYAVYKSSGLTPSAARRLYGFEEMSRREDMVKGAIQDAQNIRESTDMLVQAKDKDILLSQVESWIIC